MRRYALAAQIIDISNSRSSHTQPTPRGGGVAVVVSFSALVGGLASAGLVPAELTLILLTGGLLVVLMGYLDDRRPLPARWCFLAQMVAAVWALWCMGGISPVPVFGVSIDLSWIGVALASTYLVWMPNLQSFMNGVNGSAGLEDVAMSLSGAFTGSKSPPPLIGCSWSVSPRALEVSLYGTPRRPGPNAPCTPRRAALPSASQLRIPVHLSPPRLAQGGVVDGGRVQSDLAVAAGTGRLGGLAGTLIAHAPLAGLAYRYKAGDRAGKAT